MREIKSRSVEGKVWKVRLFEDERGRYWECGCPAFLFNNPKNKPCFHILEAIKGGEK